MYRDILNGLIYVGDKIIEGGRMGELSQRA